MANAMGFGRAANAEWACTRRCAKLRRYVFISARRVKWLRRFVLFPLYCRSVLELQVNEFSSHRVRELLIYSVVLIY